MRKVLTILITLIAFTSLSAQNRHGGVALGADRDTLKYIIASPFDNWYVNVGGGLQTFIGNEIHSSARHNKLNFNGQVELGKWIIPDLAVSLRYSLFNVDGQSRYPLNPFVDFTGAPTHLENGETYYEYQPFHAYAMSLLGYVTLDLTNFFNGYETGKRTGLHWRIGIGLGMSMLFGNQVNPNSDAHDVGDFRRNFELAYSFLGGFEYALTEHTAIFSRLELFGSESTWDWSPYDNSHSIFDLIPSINAGARFNLLSHIEKYHPARKTAIRDTVYHEFQTISNSNLVKTLNGKIDRLKSERDNLINDMGRRNPDDSLTIDSLNNELNLLQEKVNNRRNLDDSLTIDSLNNEINRLQEKVKNYDTNAPYRPQSLIDELLDINEALGLPQTVVYFELDKYYLDYNARVRLQSFASKAKKLSDTIEFYMIGAADSLTGSISHNQWLSERRCEAAYKMLTENFDLSGNQLIQVYAGGIDVYKPQEHNRMVLIIQRTPVTEEIVERWKRMSRERLEKDKSRR